MRKLNGDRSDVDVVSWDEVKGKTCHRSITVGGGVPLVVGMTRSKRIHNLFLFNRSPKKGRIK